MFMFWTACPAAPLSRLSIELVMTIVPVPGARRTVMSQKLVFATGSMRGDTFVAEEVLAKHDENYMPKEVADKMGVSHRKHNVQETPAP